MPELIIYLIKANIALCLFYLAYRLGLRRLTFYTLNRFFLLSGIIFSSLFPLVDVNDFFNRSEMAQQVITFVPDLNTWQAAQPEAFTVWAFMEWVFWAGVGVMFLRLMVQLASLLLLHRKTAPGTVLQRNVRLMRKAMNPFSFFRNIYVNPSLHSEEELTAILSHEAVHVKEWHTADVMLGEMNNVFYWFNPGAWLMKTAIRENLEFLTDRAILRSGMDPKAYQYSLIQVNTSRYATGIANNFNFSHLKNRISMMNKRNSSRLHIYRYAVLACLVCGVLLSLNFTKPGTMVNDVVTEVRTAFTDPGTTVKEAANEVENTAVIKKHDTVPAPKERSTTVTVANGVVPGRLNAMIVEGRPNGLKDTVHLSASRMDFQTGSSTVTVTGGDTIVKPAERAKTVTGKVSGITIQPGSGPGKTQTAGATRVTLHNVVTHNKPLLVVDGDVELFEDFEHVKPETIESISVLKDQSAAAIYGTAGRNGVILVTTKKGKGLNEVKLLEAKPAAGSDNGLEEVVVTGIKSKTTSAGKDNGLEEVVVTGRPRTTTSAGSGKELEEVTVTGMQRKKRTEPFIVSYKTTPVAADSARTSSFAAAPSASGKSGNKTAGVFPNPTDGLVNVSFHVPKAGNGHLEVVDLNGKRVYYKSLNGFSGSYKGTIDLRNRPAGTYVMNIAFGDGTRMSSKIVKQ